jgi:hypothetical protein
MKNIYEIFDEFERAQTHQQKVDVLRRNGNFALRSILQGTFHPDIQFVFQEVPQYKPSNSPPGLSYTSIHQEMGRVYLFEKNNSRADQNLSMERRKQILTQILESLEAREAKVFMGMLFKKQDVKGLTYDLVLEAFPDLLPAYVTEGQEAV